jgi:class 3 adenylate cyclase
LILPSSTQPTWFTLETEAALVLQARCASTNPQGVAVFTAPCGSGGIGCIAYPRRIGSYRSVSVASLPTFLMHRSLKKLLPDAEGESRLVVVANVDIRGFTTFSESVDSVLGLLYVRKVFERILADYFDDAEFFKLTGDGLLIIFSWDDRSLTTVVRKVVGDALKLVTAFPRLVADDPAINFDVPSNIGIGLARGSASRLRTRRTILDYSGRPLNLASRLMELARPSGVVVDGQFGLDLLAPAVRERFSSDQVYLSGIAEREPHEIYYTSDYTQLNPIAKQQIRETQWERVRETYKLRDIRDLSPVYKYPLPSKPLDPDEINIEFETTILREGKPTGNVTTWPASFSYELDAGRPTVEIRFDTAVAQMRSGSRPIAWNRVARLHIDYPRG